MDEFMSLLIEHEGLKKMPYTDTVGKLTIGIGRNLTDRGISVQEAIHLCENDIRESRMELGHYDWFNEMDKVRKDVLVELHFNIGLSRLLKFENMIEALKKKRYGDAAAHMLDSRWRQQVGDKRSGNMAKRLATGKY